MNDEVRPPMGGNDEVRPDDRSAPTPAPLLDEATVNRIQAKELEANAKSEASLAARTEKSKKAKSLRDQIRLEQLRTIPKKNRSEEEQREFDRLYSRQRRAKERGENFDVASQITSREQFWTLNKATADPKKISDWKQRHERCFDILAWMDRVDAGGETPELCGEDYVSVEDGADGLIADVKENGVTYLGYIRRNPDVPSDWSTGAWNGKVYWQDQTLFRMLCDESPNMERYVKYGLLTALPDWRVTEFLTRHCGWSWTKAAEFVGIRVNHLNEASYGSASSKPLKSFPT